MSENKLKSRNEVPSSDKWDLSTIYNSEADWEKAFASLPELSHKVASYKGKLASNKETFLAFLKDEEAYNRCLEDVYHYASLLNAGDQGDSHAQQMINKAQSAYTQCSEEQSFILPEMIAIPDSDIAQWLKDKAFDDYRIHVQKALHAKEHTLSEKEERILALSGEAASCAQDAFSLLNDVDLEFGNVKMDGEEKALTHGSWSTFLECQDRNVREEAYKKFYGVYEKHVNTLASLYASSVKKDIFYARARGYKSSLDSALYELNVPESVYRNLIETVHKNLPALHKYYALRKKILGVSELRHYDVYVPLAEDVKTNISYEESVEICRKALSPLGKDYTDTLCNGLLNGWADRYENKGKTSGAFSSGCYTGYPYILLNYESTSIGNVFTMAHEGGHSMHSYHAVHNNPFPCYDYTIFEAEVASTFNEELVFQYLIKQAEQNGDKAMKRYLLSDHIDGILATLYRQTMFAEFELKAHEAQENGEPLTADSIRKLYRDLLQMYFGPDMVFEENSDLECLRIPHFYNMFYVYQYATGICASLALAKRVLNGGENELNDYYNFLKSGGSRYPIDALKVGGVDMSSTEPIQAALDTFSDLVKEFEKTL